MSLFSVAETKDWWQRYWGWMLIAAALAASVVYYLDVREREAQSQCQLQFNNTFAHVIALRSDSTGDRQDAVDELIAGVGRLVVNPPTTATEQRRAAREYEALFKQYDLVAWENEQVRAANPYPELPNCSV